MSGDSQLYQNCRLKIQGNRMCRRVDLKRVRIERMSKMPNTVLDDGYTREVFLGAGPCSGYGFPSSGGM